MHKSHITILKLPISEQLLSTISNIKVTERQLNTNHTAALYNYCDFIIAVSMYAVDSYRLQAE